MKSDVSSPFAVKSSFKKTAEVVNRSSATYFSDSCLFLVIRQQILFTIDGMPYPTGLSFSYYKTGVFVVESTSNGIYSNKRG